MTNVSYLCNFLSYLVTSSFSRRSTPHILSFSSVLSLCCSSTARDQASHPYKATGKVIFSYILIFRLPERTRGDEGKSGPNAHKIPAYHNSILHFNKQRVALVQFNNVLSAPSLMEVTKLHKFRITPSTVKRNIKMTKLF